MKKFFALMVLVAVASVPVFGQLPQPKPDPAVKGPEKVFPPEHPPEHPSGAVLGPDGMKVMPSLKAATIPLHLQDISVTIVAKNSEGGGSGSGVIKSRTTKSGETINFVWTAAHVVEHLRKTHTVIDSKSGGQKTVVEFDDAMVVKAIVEDGRMVGKAEFFAELIRYSADEDLAILKVRKKNYIKSSVGFYLGKDIPVVGTDLIHVGSLLGELGSNSMTKGIMSQHGRLINKKVFDQTTCTAFRGSSGGGVFLTDGRCVGLVLRGAGETFNLIGPVRRMQEWARSAQVEWAMDDSIPLPSEADMKKLPVEDNGVGFTYSIRSSAPPKEEQKVNEIQFRGNGPFYLGSQEVEARFPTYLYWTPSK